MSLAQIGKHSFKHRGLLLPLAVVIFFIPSPPLSHDVVAVSAIGLLLALIGQAIRIGTIGLAYIIRGGKDRLPYADTLVTSGIYAHTRNPMYLGNAFLLAGLAIATDSWVFVLIGVPIAVALHVTMIAAEEDFLRGKFGAEFIDYCRATPRIWPRLSGLWTTLSSMTFNWKRVADREYAKPFDWVSAACLVILFNLWHAGILQSRPIFAAILSALILVRLALWVRAKRLGIRPANAT